MEHPKDKGDRSTLAIMTVLSELEYAMYVPFGENTRVDLVIEKGRPPASRAVQDRATSQRRCPL
jgi:hypothetical protein